MQVALKRSSTTDAVGVHRLTFQSQFYTRKCTIINTEHLGDKSSTNVVGAPIPIIFQDVSKKSRNVRILLL